MHTPSSIITVISNWLCDQGKEPAILIQAPNLRKFEAGIEFLWNQICGVFTTLFRTTHFYKRHNAAGEEIYSGQLK